MKDIGEIREIVKSLGREVGASQDLTKVLDGPGGNGEAFVKVSEEFYEYIIEERGYIFETRATKNVEDVLYWIMNDVIFKVASEYEIKNRVAGRDFRRLLFDKEIELFKRINLKWAERRKEERGRRLAPYPYND